jgi:hypothetical protein
MRSKTKNLVFIGAASYLLAWFVPVVAGGTGVTSGTLPGWEAFRAALSPVWAYEHLDLSEWPSKPAWYWSVLYVVSGLTNLVLVGALLRIMAQPDQPHPLLRAMLFAAGAFNTWFLLIPDRSGLRLGYYMWAIAYFLIAAGVAPSRTIKQGTATGV